MNHSETNAQGAITCAAIKILLWWRFHGSRDEAENRTIFMHVGTCERCRREERFWDELAALIQELKVGPPERPPLSPKAKRAERERLLWLWPRLKHELMPWRYPLPPEWAA